MYAFIVTVGILGQALALLPVPVNLPVGACNDGTQPSLALDNDDNPFLLASGVLTAATLFVYLILAAVLVTTTLRLAALGCAALAVTHLVNGTLLPFAIDMENCLLGVTFHLQMILALAWIARGLISPIQEDAAKMAREKAGGMSLGGLFY